MSDPNNAFQTAEPQIQTLWLPFLVGILLSSIVGMLWWILNEQERRELHEKITNEADRLASYIEADMRSRIPALQRMVKRWEIRGGTPEDEFVHDAQAYISELPGFRGLAWVDSRRFVRWVIPVAGNEQARDLNLTFEKKRRKALEEAVYYKRPTMTPPIELVQGYMGFLIFCPIIVRGESDGFIVAVFQIQQWLDYVFNIKGSQKGQGKFIVQVSIGDIPVFTKDNWEKNSVPHLESAAGIEVVGHRFTVRCRPTADFIEQNRTLLNEIIGIAGVLLAILVSFTVHLFQKATVEAWRTHAAKTSLEVANQKLMQTRDELQQTYTRLTLAAKAGRIGIWGWNIRKNQLTWNDIMYEIYDTPPDVMPLYDTWKNKVHSDDIQETEKQLLEAVEGKTIFDTEFRIVLTDGRIRDIRAAARVERDSSGAPVFLNGANWDITERKQAEVLLATERRRLSDILEGTNVGTWEWNVQTGETVFNERWAGIIGYTLDEISPTTIEIWMMFAHPEDLERSGELLEKHFSGELDYYECEARMRHKDGTWIWVLDRGKVATWTEDGKPLLMSGTHQDITERKQSEEKIRHLATHDALTNLPSLRLAKDRAEMAVRTAKRNKSASAVMFVDLDGFKAINDNHGHDAGDELLKEAARRFVSCVRKSDTVARIGGDEFLVILTDIQNPEDIPLIARKLLRVVSEPYVIPRNHLKVGASIGIAIYPEHGEDVETLIKKADDAMYSVKHSGKNGYAKAS